MNEVKPEKTESRRGFLRKLTGWLFIHQGDDSGFVAERR